MDFITINDKDFIPYISSEKILESVKLIAKKINADLSNENPLFLVVLNGSFMFAADLMKEIHIPCEISFIKLHSYDGMHSQQEIKELLGLRESVTNRLVVIVEDIVDTGNTIEYIKNILLEKGAKSIRIASLLFKPEAYLKAIPLDYVAMEIPNYFVVGYGLDYNGKGRNLRAIYKLKE